MASLEMKRLSTITLPGMTGKLVLCSCPGRWDRPAPRELGTEQAVAEDLGDLAGLGLTGLVSLLESDKFPGGAAAFAIAARRAGLVWVHMPIQDYGAPDQIFAEQWRDLGLRERLASGEVWGIHCWAGLGRTGLVAAQILIEAGQDPADAIARIRREHAAEAIETKAQVDHLLRLKNEA